MSKFWKDVFQYGLAGILTIGEFVMLAYLLSLLSMTLKNPAPTQSDVTLLVQVFGLVMGYHSAWLLSINYFFGSTKGSSEKNDIIAAKNP